MAADEPPADPYQAEGKYEFGRSRLPLALIDEQIRKTPAAGYPEIEAKLLTVLRSPETTKDAKRFICRWLSVVGSARCVPAVSELLTDADLSHPARMALEPMANPAAGAALRAALPKVQGKLLAGVIASIGVRRDPEAIEALRGLAGQGDPVVAGAAVAALGEIGTEEAAKVLNGLRVPEGLARTLARARIAVAGRLAAAGKGAEAAAIYRALIEPEQPRPVRVAALVGQIGSLGRAEAAKLIVELLQGDDAGLRTATLAALVGSTDKALRDAVADELPAMKPAGQLVLLGVLADLADVSARASVVKVLQSTGDEKIRLAALECLARHGEAPDVELLVRTARGKSAAEAHVARKVLQRMGKPGVDEALVRLIESPDAEDRAVVLSALASRRVESALPTFVRLLEGPDAALATEAAKALGVLGGVGQLTPLASLLTRTPGAELRSASEEAVKSICNRAVDKQAAAKALLVALEGAGAPAGRLSLVPLLAYTRGPEALGAVGKAMQDASEEVREAAIRTLVAWPEAAAAPQLLELARTAQKPSHAVLALRDGCLRLAAMKDVPMPERVSIYRSVLGLARRPEEKRQAVAGVAQVPSVEALALLLETAKDPAVGGDAVAAALGLARQLAPVFPKQAAGALEQIKPLASAEPLRKQWEEAERAVHNTGLSPEGFLVAWMLSGPYVQEGKTGSDLFDIPFAPEKREAVAEWRPVAVAPGGGPRLVELDKILGGQERVAYLRTRITSAKAQDAVLLVGSDDGVKIWLNGRVVHANNAIRPCAPDQDKAPIKLRQGTNTLLVKLTQGGGEWSICVRLRSPDGKPLEGVSAAPGD
jgi:HEAT repeat protein